MSRGKRISVITGSIVVAALAVVAIVWGVIGITQSVSAGGQTTICGVKVGVTASDQTARLVGLSDEALSPGDRVRLSPLCVVEVVSIDSSNAAPGEDGGSAHVQLKWRLW